MPKPFCRGCLSPIAKTGDDHALPLCAKCWDCLSIAERAHLLTLLNCETSLSKVEIWMQHISDTNHEIAKLKHAVERTTVAIKQPMAEMDEAMGLVQKFTRWLIANAAAEAKREKKEEPWRESLDFPDDDALN